MFCQNSGSIGDTRASNAFDQHQVDRSWMKVWRLAY